MDHKKTEIYCCICRDKQLENLMSLGYKNKKAKLFYHSKCQEKLLLVIDTILKNQIFSVDKKKFVFEKKNTNSKNEYLNSKKDFREFAKLYRLDELIKQVQLNEPFFFILDIISQWI